MDFKVRLESPLQEKLMSEKENKRSRIHSMHRYFGKLIPAIPSFAIKEFTDEGDVVCDPFMGSGTTLVEAGLHKRRGLGYDINPISCFISKVKTTAIKIDLLKRCNSVLMDDIKTDDEPVSEEELPYCINRDHWFKNFVQTNLIRVHRNIEGFFKRHDEIKVNTDEKENIINFYRVVLSSIIRIVSNADPRHVFPGYSKRLRRLDKEGKRNINVFKSFESAIKRKTKALAEYADVDSKEETIIVNKDTKCVDVDKYPEAKLIVTNPPYISSIRYIETVKLELYWMEFLLNPTEYKNLERRMVGNDRVYKKEYKDYLPTQYGYVNDITRKIYEEDPKSGYVVSSYFMDMTDIIKKMNKMLTLDGHVVMKISNSKVKNIEVETGKFLTYIARENGFELMDAFIDDIENRSLLTARNTYSDIIEHDYILVWKKVGEAN